MSALRCISVWFATVSVKLVTSNTSSDDACPNDLVAHLQVANVETNNNVHILPDSSPKLIQNGTLTGSVSLFHSFWPVNVIMVAVVCLLLITSAHEMFIASPGRESSRRHSTLRIQSLYVALSTINCMNTSALVPGSYDLMLTLPQGPTMSGLLLGGSYVLAPVGVYLCKNFAVREQFALVRRATTVFLLLTATSALVVLSTIFSTTEVTTNFAWSLVFVKCCEGLFQNCAFYFISCMAYWFTPSSQVTSLAIASLTSICVGLALGSCVSSLMLSWEGANDVKSATARSAISLCPITLLWAILAFAFSVASPRKFDVEIETGEEGVVRKQLDVSQMTITARKMMFTMGLLYTVHRALSLSSIEVAASMYFERHYLLSVEAIGYIATGVYSGAAVLGLVILISRYKGHLSDAIFLNVLLSMSLVGSVFFFDIAGVGFASILAGDLLFYTSAFNANGIIDGWTTIATIPNTGYSLESYQALKTLLISVVRAVAPLLSRLALDKLGWEFYAFAQLFSSLLGFLVGRQMILLAEESRVGVK